MKFIISETDEILISHSGLALAGALLQGTGIQRRANGICLGERRRPEVPHGDVLTSMIGLLCLGKSDFKDIEAFRDDEFFRCSLGLRRFPRSPRSASGWTNSASDRRRCLREESAALVARHAPRSRPATASGWRWTWTFRPSTTAAQEGGRRLDVQEGGRIRAELRLSGRGGLSDALRVAGGKQHCQDGTPKFLDEAIGYARRITAAKFLVRMDAGNDAVENIRCCKKARPTTSSSGTCARNRWRTGWKRRRPTASGSFRGKARRFTRAKRGWSGTASCIAWCSR